MPGFWPACIAIFSQSVMSAMSDDMAAACAPALVWAAIEAHADPIGARAIESAVSNAMMVRKRVT